jgi:hypothetical protein
MTKAASPWQDAARLAQAVMGGLDEGCENIGLAWQSQHAKLVNQREKFSYNEVVTTAAGPGAPSTPASGQLTGNSGELNQTGADLQRKAKMQALMQVMTSPYATPGQKEFAKRHLARLQLSGSPEASLSASSPSAGLQPGGSTVINGIKIKRLN